MTAQPTRPALRYHGGKWKLAPWIIEHFPPHRIYVEPFGGGGSVLLRKPRVYGEVYNDLDGEVVNVFRVMRDPAAAEDLCRRVGLTPFARAEFRWAYEEPVDDVDRAHRMIVRSFMGFGSASMTREHMTGFRSNASRNGSTPAQDWARWPAQIERFTARLMGVAIENRPASEVIIPADSTSTLYYVDPPYVHGTRSSLKNKNGNIGHYYRHDMDDDGHRALARVLRAVRGMVVLSGYPSALYDDLYAGWVCSRTLARADGARERTEVLWLNPACAEALEHGTLQRRLIG